MNNSINDIEEIKRIILNQNHEEIKGVIRSLISKYSTDICTEPGVYAPTNPEEPWKIDWEQKKWFNNGDAFPDDRDWIPIGTLKDMLHKLL